MRLWTLHPRYLDMKGLCALWREALLAQAVLRGRTRGYRAHPQLVRFRAQPDPLACIAAYLRIVWEEGRARGVRFDGRRIAHVRSECHIDETAGQLRYEWRHLLTKLKQRATQEYRRSRAVHNPEPHPLFRIVPGPVREWERKK